MKRRKLLGMLLAVTVAAFTLAGCGSTPSGDEGEQQDASEEEPDTSEEEQTPDEGDQKSPQKTRKTPRMWSCRKWKHRMSGFPVLRA